MSDKTKSMAHEEAERTNAVEGYLLNDLPEEDRERFEEHYFACPICAEAVSAGQDFIQGIRPLPVSRWQALWAKVGNPVSAPAWQAALLVCATAMSLGWAGMQEFSAPPLIATATANTAILARPQQKGTLKAYAVRTPSVTVEFTLPDQPLTFSHYLVKLKREPGKTISEVVVPKPAEKDERRLSVQIARTSLGEGRFTIDVDGLQAENDKAGRKIETYYFDTAAF